MSELGRLLYVLPLLRPAEARMANDLPRPARALLAALRRGDASWLPPIARATAQGALEDVPLRAPAALAARLAGAFATPRFAPFLAFLEALDRWCARAARAQAKRIASGVLGVENGALFGRAIADALVVVAARGADASSTLDTLRDGLERALALFFDRFAADAAAGILRDAGYQGKLTALAWRGEETHNGGQSVLQLTFASGGALAYKPRPSGGEWIFARDSRGRGPRSVFEVLNALAPASGRVRLPTLRVLRGAGREPRAYGWHEWIMPPSSSRPSSRRGHRLGRGEQASFWHRAGSLSASAFAFGVEDLIRGNVMPGQRPGERAPSLFPIDLEVFGTPITSLVQTGLVAEGARNRFTSPHVGLQRAALRSSPDGPVACFFPGRDGALELRETRRPRAETQASGVIADARGRTGYGHHIAAFLRGMFDVWTLLMVHRDRIIDAARDAAKGEVTRVLLRPTAAYVDALRSELLGGRASRRGGALLDAERAQLERLDVPYFARRCTGGPLLAVAPPPARGGLIAACEVPAGVVVPGPEVLAGSLLTWEGLACAIRDAVAYVAPDLDGGVVLAPEHGVVLDGRSVTFEWREAGQRLRFAWTRRTVRMTPEPIALAPARRDDEVRRQLLAVDRLDASLRQRWLEGGGTDRALAKQLAALLAAATPWLASVVEEHGWPGRALVGGEASRAACRLLQHADVPRAFGARCLHRMHVAALADDIPRRDVAYATDALRLAGGQRQLFGTKLARSGDGFVPLPTEDPARLDARRRRMGLAPIGAYLRRAQAAFGGAASASTATATATTEAWS